MKTKDPLGTRIKANYEDRYRFLLPRRSYLIIRLDQCCGHTYTRGLQKPFDQGYIEDLDNAVLAAMKRIHGSVFAYVQSDEVSVLITDFEKKETEAWFDNNLQKMVSVSAALLTMHFNMNRMARGGEPNAIFDSRVFTIPDKEEIANMFIWRNQDCFKNCISSYAQANFSHKELHGKTTEQRIQMLYNKGVVDIREDHKFGRVISNDIQPAWKFTEDRPRLMGLIPNHGY